MAGRLRRVSNKDNKSKDGSRKVDEEEEEGQVKEKGGKVCESNRWTGEE